MTYQTQPMSPFKVGQTRPCRGSSCPTWPRKKLVTSRPNRSTSTAAAHRGRRWWPESWEKSSNLDDEILTVFGSDGTITNIPPLPPPSPLGYHPALASLRPHQALPTPEEQGLCIGSVFTISATNGVDVTRRMNVLGFCQSVEMLYETVERTVARRGGEVLTAERFFKSGVHECLTMALAVPLLWGVPPEHERLKSGIESGGGIIDRVYKEWFILG